MGEIRVSTDSIRSALAKLQYSEDILSEICRSTGKAFRLRQEGVKTDGLSNALNKTEDFIDAMNRIHDRFAVDVLNLKEVADKFEEANYDILVSINDGKFGEISGKPGEQPCVTDTSEWRQRSTDTEYALLSGICSSVTANCGSKSKEQIKDEFIKELRKRLPLNDPLMWIDPECIEICIDPQTGFSAIVIENDRDSATVIFAGTNGDFNDVMTDIAIAFGTKYIAQEMQANGLIDGLSKKHSHISVTGHSLGGYLAVNTAINHTNVEKCIAFDPPKQTGEEVAKYNADDNRITSYVTTGLVHHGGFGGHINERLVDYPWNTRDEENNLALDRIFQHNIDDIYNAMGGDAALERIWDGPVSGGGSGGGGGSGR